MGGGLDFIFGGKSKVKTSKAYAEMSPEEKQRMDSIEAAIQQMNPNTSNQISNLFQDQLKSFLVGGSQNPNPTPEQLNQATQFVDQTFTNPAQQQLKQQTADFTSQQNAQAAALGRNPNTDIATQQAILSASARAGQGMQAERGARIQQAAREFNDVGYNRGLQNLQAGMSGGGFLSNLGQQAFQNRLGLLNARSGIADYYQRQRAQQAVGTSTSPGLLGTAAAGMSNIAKIAAPIAGFAMGGPAGGALGAVVGQSLGGMPTGEYTSSSGGIANPTSYRF